MFFFTFLLQLESHRFCYLMICSKVQALFSGASVLAEFHGRFVRSHAR